MRIREILSLSLWSSDLFVTIDDVFSKVNNTLLPWIDLIDGDAHILVWYAANSAEIHGSYQKQTCNLGEKL